MFGDSKLMNANTGAQKCAEIAALHFDYFGPSHPVESAHAFPEQPGRSEYGPFILGFGGPEPWPKRIVTDRLASGAQSMLAFTSLDQLDAVSGRLAIGRCEQVSAP